MDVRNIVVFDMSCQNLIFTSKHNRARSFALANIYDDVAGGNVWNYLKAIIRMVYVETAIMQQVMVNSNMKTKRISNTAADIVNFSW